MFKILAVSLFVLVATPVMHALADSPALTRTITVNGHGETKASPDMAFVELGVSSQGATAGAALAANTKNMSALMAALKAAGIDDKDIQTSNFSVGPRYENSNGTTPPKVVGYDVNNNVSVAVHKLDDLGVLLDKAVGAGSNQINGISFTISKPQALQDDARKSAVQDAKRKAALLADAAGAKLGPVVTIQDGGSPMPYAMRNAPMMADAMAKGGAPVPVAQGEMTLASDVNVVWELVPGAP